MENGTRRLVEWFSAQFRRVGVNAYVCGIDTVAGSVEVSFGDARWTTAINDARHYLLALADDSDEDAFRSAMDRAANDTDQAEEGKAGTITTRIERWQNGIWSTSSVSTTATDDDPCRDHEADLSCGGMPSEYVYEALECGWEARDDGAEQVEVELLDANHDQYLFRLSRVSR